MRGPARPGRLLSWAQSAQTTASVPSGSRERWSGNDGPSGGARPRRFQLFLAYVSGGFGLAFTSMVGFLVPLRAHELGASTDLIGLIVGAGALVPAMVSVPLGRLIDHVGPRRAFLLGGSGSAVLVAALAAAPTPLALLLLQLPLGGTRTLAWIASQSYVTSIATGEARARHTGRFSVVTNASLMAAPLLVGTTADVLGFSKAFLVVAAYAGVFVLVGLALPAPPTAQRSAPPSATGFRTAGRLLRLPGIQAAMLLTGARLSITSVWTAFFPIFLVSAGLSPTVVGTVMSFKAAIGTVTALAAGQVARWLGSAMGSAAALALGALGVALSPFFATLPWVYLPPILLGVAQGLSLPLLIAMVSAHAPDEQRGVVLGLRASVNQAASVAAPVAIGPLIATAGVIVGFPLSALGIGTTLVIVVWLHRSASATGRHPSDMA